MRAVSLRLLLTSRALPRQCLGAGLKRSGPMAASGSGDELVGTLRQRPQERRPAEAPFAADVDDAYPLAAMAAELPVALRSAKGDWPYEHMSAGCSRRRPRPAVPEPEARQADQLLPVAKLDDRMRRVELHYARRAQPWDFSRTGTRRESGG